MSYFNYRTITTLEERKHKAEELLKQYKDKVPIILEQFPKSHLPTLEKTRFLLQRNVLVEQFLFLIRKKLNLNLESPLFLITEKIIVLNSKQTMNDIYLKCKDKKDKFLYLYYTSDIPFGNK